MELGFGSFVSVLNLLFRDKEVLAAERAVEKQKMEENLVENKMNVILDSGLFSKVPNDHDDDQIKPIEMELPPSEAISGYIAPYYYISDNTYSVKA